MVYHARLANITSMYRHMQLGQLVFCICKWKQSIGLGYSCLASHPLSHCSSSYASRKSHGLGVGGRVVGGACVTVARLRQPVKCCALDIIHQLNDLIYMVKHGMWRVIVAVAVALVALHCCCCCCFRRYFHYYYFYYY